MAVEHAEQRGRRGTKETMDRVIVLPALTVTLLVSATSSPWYKVSVLAKWIKQSFTVAQ
jgi:hypothetical protein